LNAERTTTGEKDERKRRSNAERTRTTYCVYSLLVPATLSKEAATITA